MENQREKPKKRGKEIGGERRRSGINPGSGVESEERERQRERELFIRVWSGERNGVGIIVKGRKNLWSSIIIIVVSRS